jgi:short-chain fatty acids transporter
VTAPLSSSPTRDNPRTGLESERLGAMAALASALTQWSERWVPDAFVFALVATVVVFLAAVVLTPTPALRVIDVWGSGVWELIPFTMQMALIIITGYVLASAPPVRRLIDALARLPRSPRQAVALVSAFALISAWFNWGFSLAFSAVLARRVARQVKHVDYRAIAAASVLGLGSIWAQGLSGSAALQMATPAALPPRIRDIVAHGGVVPDGLITFRHTVFLWQSFASVFIELAIVTAVMWFATPVRSAKTAEAMGIDVEEHVQPPAVRRTPGAGLENSPLLSLLIVAIGAAYLAGYFARAADPFNALNLNVINLAFLLAGLLLHRTPARLAEAVRVATPAVWSLLLQYPFYAGIAAMISGTHLNDRLAAVFVGVSTHATYPAIVALYSAVLGVFIPSGGSKWVVEAPYVMEAAHTLRVHLGWVVSSYDLGEALANLVQPFWMVPVLGVFKLEARDIMGYTFVVFLVMTPVVVALVTIFGLTLGYPL